MQILRTILWVVILVALLAFSFFNWRPVEVTVWENLVLETKIPALVVLSFLLGLVPTWLWSRGVRWRLNRRIASLEAAARTRAAREAVPAPARSPTLEDDERPHGVEPVAPPLHDPAAPVTVPADGTVEPVAYPSEPEIEPVPPPPVDPLAPAPTRTLPDSAEPLPGEPTGEVPLYPRTDDRAEDRLEDRPEDRDERP